jgi:hypothetical protein
MKNSSQTKYKVGDRFQWLGDKLSGYIYELEILDSTTVLILKSGKDCSSQPGEGWSETDAEVYYGVPRLWKYLGNFNKSYQFTDLYTKLSGT